VIVGIATWVLAALLVAPFVISAVVTWDFSNPVFSWYSDWLRFPLVTGIISVFY